MSKLFKIDWKDFLKGLILGVGTPLIYLAQELLPTFGLNQWQQVALSAFIAYIIKNFISDSNGNILGKEDGIGGSQIPPNKDEK